MANLEEHCVKAIILKRFKPGKYILFNFFQNVYKGFNKKEVNLCVRKAINMLKKEGKVRKGVGGMYYVTDENGANPFYSKDIKLSKYRMEHLSIKDIRRNSGKRGIKLLKARSGDDFQNNYSNYTKKREVVNKVTNKKCRICGKKSYCMHHIIPLSKGGTNRPDNLIPVCLSCHREIHPFMK